MSALARLAPVSPKIGTNAGGSVPPLLKNALSALATLRWLGLVFLTGTAAAAAILRIELRSSRYFRFESRRRSAAPEKVWIVEATFDCVGKRAGSPTPAVPTGLRWPFVIAATAAQGRQPPR